MGSAPDDQPIAEFCLLEALDWVDSDAVEVASFAQAWGLAERAFADRSWSCATGYAQILAAVVGILHSPEAMGENPFYIRQLHGEERPFEVATEGADAERASLPLLVPNFRYLHSNWAPSAMYWVDVPGSRFPTPPSPRGSRAARSSPRPPWVTALETQIALLLWKFGDEIRPATAARNGHLLVLSPYSETREELGKMFQVGQPVRLIPFPATTLEARAEDSWAEALHHLNYEVHTLEDSLDAIRTFPHLVRARLQVNTAINDTGNTQRHTIVNLPYISRLGRNKAASLVGISRCKGTLWILGPFRAGIEQMGTTWGWMARACRDLNLVLTPESGAGGLLVRDIVRLGDATSDMGFDRAALTLLEPLSQEAPLHRHLVTPLDVARAFGFPLYGRVPPKEWRVPPSTIVLVGLSPPAHPLDGLRDMRSNGRLDNKHCRWYRLRTPAAAFYATGGKNARFWLAVVEGYAAVFRGNTPIATFPHPMWTQGLPAPGLDVTIKGRRPAFVVQVITHTSPHPFPWIWDPDDPVPDLVPHKVRQRATPEAILPGMA